MQNKSWLLAVLFIWGALFLAACSGDDSSGDVEAGRQLFEQTTIGNSAGCKTCHSLELDTIIVGPSLAGVGTRAEKTIPDLSAEEYLRQSILEPEAHIVEGFPSRVMPNEWGDELSEEQIDNLVAFLLSLK